VSKSVFHLAVSPSLSLLHEKNVLPLKTRRHLFYFLIFSAVKKLKGKKKINMADNDDLLDYEDEEQTDQVVAEVGDQKKDVKGTYVSIHSSGFRDFLLKPEILRAIVDCGFEHPSAGEEKFGENFMKL
jgi:hypothetical protein